MAKAPTPPPAAAETAALVPKRGKKLLMLLIAAVLVVALLAAAAVGLLLLKKGHADAEGGEDAPAAAVDLSKPPTFVPMDPFVVNLAPAEGERYLQVVMALRVADMKTGENLKAFMPEIRHQINLLLSSKLPSELSTMEGREALAAEIVTRTNSVLGGAPAKQGNGKATAPAGPIQAVLFNSFIIQ
ncbi:flagellar basal body-associated FliL family protein [Azoarcus sp. DN11]|uniref:flagellar basal body-associated FliL family protein n=1 Tax=Azoarcus sp. DN11 TaxID=356837 RepID=UPI000EB4DDF1|nr:flagellar basal body-associated FliL family protein [Azoarcus sp. DN11]AYH43094.1 flagellar basal body protein FliL [Azoarcus sp. DN11]